MRQLLILTIGLSFLQACAEPVERWKPKSPKLPPALSGTEAIRTPSNPDGGLIPGKEAEISVEESSSRQAINSAQALIFGKSAAGISMDTTRSAAKDILSNPAYTTDSGMVAYPEFLHIVWQTGVDPKPKVMIVTEGYKGALELPAPFGKLELGKSYERLMKTPADRQHFMLELGAALEGKGSDYDCEIEGSCMLEKSELSFRQGSLVFDDAGRFIYFYIWIDQAFPKRSKDAIVYGESMGGITFSSTRMAVEQRFGAPLNPGKPLLAYDAGNLYISWDEMSSTPKALIATEGYLGTLSLGAVKKKIGDSFAEYGKADDEGKQLMLSLDRLLEKRADGFDCSTVKPKPLCRLEKDETSLVVLLNKASFHFSFDSSRTLLRIDMLKP